MSFEPRVSPPENTYTDGVPNLASILGHYVPATFAERNAFNEAVESCSTDPQARELMRLHNAEVIDCNFCRNVRYGGPSGLPIISEKQVGKIRSFARSDLPAAHKAALRFAEAFAMDPDSVPTEVLPGLRAHYTNRQIVELGLQLVRCRAGSKLLVSLGLEPRSMPITII